MFKQKYFIVIVEKKQSSITYMSKHKVIAHFIGDFISQKQEFKKILAMNRDAGIILIVNNEEQYYTKTEEPASELFTLYNQIADFDLSITKNDLISAWLSFLTNLNNRIIGVYALILEAKALIDLLAGNSPRAQWEILEYNSQYIIYHNQKFIAKKTNLAEYKDDKNVKIYKLDSDIDLLNIQTPETLIGYASIHNKHHYKLYNPDLSPLILTEKINFYLNILLCSGVMLMIIIFLYFWHYLSSMEEKLEILKRLLH